MRVIPPMHYNGKIPEGYDKKQFFRFDQGNGETYGVLYSGQRININEPYVMPDTRTFKQRVMDNIKLWFKYMSF